MGNDKEQRRRRVGKRKQKRHTGKRKGRVLSWEDKTDFFVSACKMSSPDYLSLGSSKLFFLITRFSSSTSLGPHFASSALTESSVGLT